MSTAPPLCLEPDPRLARIANNVLRVSVPTTPVSLKRKAVAMEQEEEESEKARRVKIMQYMNPRVNRSTAPRFVWSIQFPRRIFSSCIIRSYHILDVVEKVRRQRAQLAAQSSQSNLPGSTPVAPPKFGPPQPALSTSPAPSAASPSTSASTPSPAPAPTSAPATYTNGIVNGAQNRSTPAPKVATPQNPTIPSATPAPPTPTPAPTIPAVAANVTRYQTPRPPSVAPPSAIPHHMQAMYTTQAPRTTNTPPPNVPRPPSTVANGAASSPIQRPASIAQAQIQPPQVQQPLQSQAMQPPAAAQRSVPPQVAQRPQPMQQQPGQMMVPQQPSQPQVPAFMNTAFSGMTPQQMQAAVAKMSKKVYDPSYYYIYHR